jgi:hypothetical protein
MLVIKIPSYIAGFLVRLLFIVLSILHVLYYAIIFLRFIFYKAIFIFFCSLLISVHIFTCLSIAHFLSFPLLLLKNYSIYGRILFIPQ